MFGLPEALFLHPLDFTLQILLCRFAIMPHRIKWASNKGESSSNPSWNPGKCPIVGSPPHPYSKRNVESFSPCRDAISLERYQRIFSHRAIIIKRTVDPKTLRTTHLTELLKGRQWMPLILVSRPVQEEAVRIFYANFFDINNEEHSFWFMVGDVLV